MQFTLHLLRLSSIRSETNEKNGKAYNVPFAANIRGHRCRRRLPPFAAYQMTGVGLHFQHGSTAMQLLNAQTALIQILTFMRTSFSSHSMSLIRGTRGKRCIDPSIKHDTDSLTFLFLGTSVAVFVCVCEEDSPCTSCACEHHTRSKRHSQEWHKNGAIDSGCCFWHVRLH